MSLVCVNFFLLVVEAVRQMIKPLQLVNVP